MLQFTGTIAACLAALAVASPAPRPRVRPASPASQPAVFELRLAFREPGEGRRAYPCPPGSCRSLTTGDQLYVDGVAIVSVVDLSSVKLVLEGDDHGIELHVLPEAAKALASATGDHIGQPIAVFVDGRLQSAPTLMDRMSDSVWLSGAYGDEELRGLAHRLSSALDVNRPR